MLDTGWHQQSSKLPPTHTRPLLWVKQSHANRQRRSPSTIVWWPSLSPCSIKHGLVCARIIPRNAHDTGSHPCGPANAPRHNCRIHTEECRRVSSVAKYQARGSVSEGKQSTAEGGIVVLERVMNACVNISDPGSGAQVWPSTTGSVLIGCLLLPGGFVRGCTTVVLRVLGLLWV